MGGALTSILFLGGLTDLVVPNQEHDDSARSIKSHKVQRTNALASGKPLVDFICYASFSSQG